jgi:hypothetical protein
MYRAIRGMFSLPVRVCSCGSWLKIDFPVFCHFSLDKSQKTMINCQKQAKNACIQQQ